MTKITGHSIDKSYEIYLALYQAVSGAEESMDVFREFSPDFFDLIIVDECHRSSAAEASARGWILCGRSKVLIRDIPGFCLST